jgi:hypothetical protein
MPLRPLRGATIVFSGFTDAAMKERLTTEGAFVRRTVSGKTDIVIAHDLSGKRYSRACSEPKAVTIAKEKDITLYDITDFRKTYWYTAFTATQVLPPNMTSHKAHTDPRIKSAKTVMVEEVAKTKEDLKTTVVVEPAEEIEAEYEADEEIDEAESEEWDRMPNGKWRRVRV